MIHKRHILLSACLTLLSATVLANFENDELQEDFSFDEILDESEIVDASMYPVISEGSLYAEKVRKMHHYVAFGEMLYLKPYMGSMPWTYVQNYSQYPSPTNPNFAQVTETINNIEMDFDFGFRLGLGFNATWLKLENQLTWMRFHTQTSQQLPTLTAITSNDITDNQPLAYAPFWFDLASMVPPGQEIGASETTKLDWDQIDWVFKVPLSPFKRATFSPLLGIRGLISEIRSNLTQISSAFGETFTLTPPLNSSSVELLEKFNAVGIFGGLDGDVNFGEGFHLSALFDVALLYGNLKTSNTISTNVPVIPGTLAPQDYYAQQENNKFKPIFDVQATLSWNRSFFKNRCTLNLHLGYEVHYMPRFIEMVRVIDAGDTVYAYDLTFQGLNAGIGLSF